MEDSDLFDTYFSKAHYITGDPEPIMETEEGDRLRVARELTYSHSRDLQHGWAAFCRSDPRAAFDLLRREDITPPNGFLWDNFLDVLAVGDDATKTMRDDLAVETFLHLDGFGQDALRPMVSGLVDLIYWGPRSRVKAVPCWLECLWELVSEQSEPEGPLDFSADFYSRSINSPARKLAAVLLREIDARRRKDLDPTEAQLRLLRKMSASDSVGGQRARAELASNIAFLVAIDRQCATKVLAPRLNAENAEGAALRAVMVRYGSITPEVTQMFRKAIMKGAIESRGNSFEAAAIASRILPPALADVDGDKAVGWGLSASRRSAGAA